MIVGQALYEVMTLAEAVKLSRLLGHPVDRANLLRYAQEGRLSARKSAGTWLTTRSALRDLVISLETQTRGRPRQVRLGEGRSVSYSLTPELATTLQEIEQLHSQALEPEQEQQLLDELNERAVYHTNHLEGNELTYEEAQAVIREYRQEPKDAGA
jgi:DNA repair ATPase RecN